MSPSTKSAVSVPALHVVDDSVSTTAAVPAVTEEPTPKGKKTWIFAAIAAVGVLGAAGFYAVTRGHEATDNAQVDAEVVAVPARASGVVNRVLFVENQVVKAGELLAELDDEQAK